MVPENNLRGLPLPVQDYTHQDTVSPQPAEPLCQDIYETVGGNDYKAM